MKEADDEELLHELFCFVYAINRDDTMFRQKVLRPDMLVLSLFTDPNLDSYLLLHLKDQDHHLMSTSPALAKFYMDDDTFSPHGSTSSAFNITDIDGDLSASMSN